MGQVVDAFVASGTPNAIASTGDATYVKGRTYRDLVRDMMDYMYWGQLDGGTGRGGWDYTANASSHGGWADNSVSQWAAIGGIAAERVWGITPPAFVKSENYLWLTASQYLNNANQNDGQFGYQGQGCVWADCLATTPSGMVQHIYNGTVYDPDASPTGTTIESRFLRSVRFMARKFRQYPLRTSPTYNPNYYFLFATAKAFRLALDVNGDPAPITTLDDAPGGDPEFDWYRNDPATPSAANPRGIARFVISGQSANGSWAGAGYWTNPLSTQYAVIILSPTVFQLGPSAKCQANPNEIGAFGGMVNFTSNGTEELNPEATIVSYEWNFGDNTIGSGASTSHDYGQGTTFPKVYNATLTVTDTNGISDTTSCPVTQVDTNVKPDADRRKRRRRRVPVLPRHAARARRLSVLRPRERRADLQVGLERPDRLRIARFDRRHARSRRGHGRVHREGARRARHRCPGD